MNESCPIRLLAKCPRQDTNRECRVVQHHLFYPKPKYSEAGRLALQFRSLQYNKVLMCEEEEKLLHQLYPEGPPMPTMEVMEHCVAHEKQRRALIDRTFNE